MKTKSEGNRSERQMSGEVEATESYEKRIAGLRTMYGERATEEEAVGEVQDVGF